MKTRDQTRHREFWQRVKCYLGLHVTSEIVAHGRIIPTEKQNHLLKMIGGRWRIRYCDRCKEIYSRPSDLLES